MPVKSRFTRLDAFTKTVEDARVRTTSGGIVTIASLLVLFWLVWGEWAEYKRVLVRPELVVDKGRGTCLFLRGNWLDMNPFFFSSAITRCSGICAYARPGERMDIHMNISFPRIPCEILTLDVMDVSGEIQQEVMHGIQKMRLAPESEGGRVLETTSLDLYVYSRGFNVLSYNAFDYTVAQNR